MITLVANLRGSDELSVANVYTYEQLHHIAGVYLKDKLFLLRVVSEAFTGKSGTNASTQTGTSTGRALPKWYRPRFRNGRPVNMKVIDLDGPMEDLAPYIGKGKIRKGRTKRVNAGKRR